MRKPIIGEVIVRVNNDGMDLGWKYIKVLNVENAPLIDYTVNCRCFNNNGEYYRFDLRLSQFNKYLINNTHCI